MEIETLKNELVGMSLDNAKIYAGLDGFEIRESIRDGEKLMLTMEYDLGRINVETENGVVIGVNGIG